MVRVAAVVVVALAMSILPSAVAPAGVPANLLTVSLVSSVEPLALDLEILTPSAGSVDCDDGTFEVVAVEADGSPVIPISVVENPSDPSRARVTLPSDTPGGFFDITAQCTIDEQLRPAQSLLFALGAVAVTKVVIGPAPPGATFTVWADCGTAQTPTETSESVEGTSIPALFALGLVYPATGGLAYFYTDHLVTCTITEPVDGGALSVSFSAERVNVSDPGSYAVTVTNSFVAQPRFTG